MSLILFSTMRGPMSLNSYALTIHRTHQELHLDLLKIDFRKITYGFVFII